MGYLSFCTSACCLIIIGCFTAQTQCIDSFKYVPGEHSIVQVAAPAAQLAKNVAGSLLHNHLAACVNMIPGVTTFVKEDDKIIERQEVLMFIKTRTSRVNDLMKKVIEYLKETCEIAAVPIESGNNLYLSWISQRVPEKAQEN